MTPEESALWRGLRQAFPDAHWRKQVPFGINYTADFCSHATKLIVEVDGGQHDEHRPYDETRTRFLNAEGYHVLRFWNNEVRENPDGVLQTVAQHISSPLVGEAGGGRRASARHETLCGEPDGSPSPTQPSPTRGEG